MSGTHLPLITASAGTQDFAALSVLNMYVVHDLNGLDACTLYTVHEEDLELVRHERTNYTCMLVLMCYTEHTLIRAYIACVLPVSI